MSIPRELKCPECKKVLQLQEHPKLLDEFADLSGILIGYSSKEVAKYCSKERLKKFNLIK